MLNRIFGRRGADATGSAAFDEGSRLYNMGKYHAGRFETDKALEFFDKSFEVNKRPEPLVDRALIKELRIRHYEALCDLTEAKRLDESHGNACESEILKRATKLAITTQLYRDGTREKLVEDLRKNGLSHAVRRVLSTSFNVDAGRGGDEQALATPILKFHFFNELDNIAKFDSRGSYPQIDWCIDEYPGAYVEAQVRLCPNRQAYAQAEMKLHTFLCSYEEQDMRKIRNDILYLIHSSLMQADYDLDFMVLGSEHKIIREALGYLEPREAKPVKPSQKGEFGFTSPSTPVLDLKSEKDVAEYASKLSKLTHREDLFIELANVMAAKYNLMSMQASLSDFESTQRLVTDLTTKATLICVLALGKEAVAGYAGTDVRRFNGLVSEIDEQVAAQDLVPAKHGEMLLIKLRNILERTRETQDTTKSSDFDDDIPF